MENMPQMSKLLRTIFFYFELHKGKDVRSGKQ